MDRRERLLQEIDRDARVTVVGYARELVQASMSELQETALSGRRPDPDRLFDEVDGLTRKFRQLFKRLGDARINRRGERPSRGEPPPEVPDPARPFAYHGRYRGAHADLTAFARSALDPRRPETWAEYVDLSRAGVELHLRGSYWTIDRDGTLYAFDLAEGARTSPAADRARALLAARLPDDAAVAAAMATYAGLFPDLVGFARLYLEDLNLPTWLMAHVDLRALAEDWRSSGAVWSVDEPGDADVPAGVHVFVRRDPAVP